MADVTPKSYISPRDEDQNLGNLTPSCEGEQREYIPFKSVSQDYKDNDQDRNSWLSGDRSQILEYCLQLVEYLQAVGITSIMMLKL